MGRPLAVWDDENSTHSDLVWRSRLDDRFQVEVQRVSMYHGELVIFDHGDGDKELFREAVGLSYGAAFGPDAGDVDEWQERCAKFIDEEWPQQQQQQTT